MKRQKPFSALFLDRDGVINVRLIDDYVKSIDTFQFTKGAPQAIASLQDFFHYTFVVTNQQGIGKGVMSEQELATIHHYMMSEVEKEGGTINQVYYSPYLRETHHHTRKPNVGMGLKAKRAFPGIQFEHSWMVGDSLTDLEFGRRLKMKTAFISTNQQDIAENDHLIDVVCPTLAHFAHYITTL